MLFQFWVTLCVKYKQIRGSKQSIYFETFGLFELFSVRRLRKKKRKVSCYSAPCVCYHGYILDILHVPRIFPGVKGVVILNKHPPSPTHMPPTDCLITMLTMVLKKNFTFNGDHYIQINGTAMGTKMAPSYANIFMGKLEKTTARIVY